MSLGAPSSDSPVIRSVVERIVAAAKAHDKPICVFAGNAAEAAWLKDFGASAFVVSSDQGFMRRGAAQALQDVRALRQNAPSA